ncbi:MAG: AAA family ATPase [Dehalococcoidales bacterium]|nr:AAA family ATPase [Dehalococcoidales bacterium]
MNPPNKIDLNPEFRQALRIIEESEKSIFITGRAGTGKSTLLKYFRDTTKKTVAIVAPTGVAALNVLGQTIHSFCRFKPNITLEQIKRLRFTAKRKNIYERLDAIVIDEISMVRADLLDCVDKFLRLNGPRSDRPFGGIQMIFIGDLYQLPPVVTSQERALFHSLYGTPYFYGARAFEDFQMEFVELEKVYRQQDAGFITLLNSIRNRTIDEAGLALLNRRYLPGFQPPAGDFYIYLTTTNALAEQINQERLSKLKNAAHSFTAEIQGDFGKEYLPTATELKVKPGSQVMMLNNDAEGRWVNGSIGEITNITRNAEGKQIIIVLLADGDAVEVSTFTWEISRYYVEGEKLQSEVVGSFTQFPLMLAWAVTIHKSQGKTFDKVIIDFGRGTFVHGQAYVALSRCTSLEGIVLKQPFRKQHILMDYDVIKFLTKFQYARAENSLPADAKTALIAKAITNRTPLEIVYLKPDDEKSRRVIVPRFIGEMEFKGKTYTGVRAFCLMRGEERTFRLERILELKEADME